MSLRKLQSEFAVLFAHLVLKMKADGYECTLNEVARSDEQAEINAIGEQGRERVAELLMAEFPELAKKILNNGKANGIRVTVHGLKLAVDINLFKNGKYLSDTASHRPYGVWWEKQHPKARWGGRWGDGNHYSFEYGGVK